MTDCQVSIESMSVPGLSTTLYCNNCLILIYVIKLQCAIESTFFLVLSAQHILIKTIKAYYIHTSAINFADKNRYFAAFMADINGSSSTSQMRSKNKNVHNANAMQSD